MKNFRNGFPVLQQYAYLNTAASGLLHERVWEFRKEHDLDFFIGGSIFKEKQGEILLGVRQKVGVFFGCAPQRVALVPNFSYGFNTFLEGLKKPKKILLLKNDYPSITRAVVSGGFKTCYAEIDENIEENIIRSLEKEKPDVFAFSVVQYLNGIKLEIPFLKKLKQDFPFTIFVADGTQFCGTEAFNFEASGLDMLISSTYKWLNAGYGNAFILFNERVQGELFHKNLKFISLQGKYKPQEGSLINKFEPGHLDTLNFGSLGVALDLLRETGMEGAFDQIAALKAAAMEKFIDLDLLEEAVVRRRQHSSIFNIKGDESMFNKLRSKNIIVSQRGEGIRVSFNYFNTLDELEYLIGCLRSSD